MYHFISSPPKAIKQKGRKSSSCKMWKKAKQNSRLPALILMSLLILCSTLLHKFQIHWDGSKDKEFILHSQSINPSPHNILSIWSEVFFNWPGMYTWSVERQVSGKDNVASSSRVQSKNQCMADCRFLQKGTAKPQMAQVLEDLKCRGD